MYKLFFVMAVVAVNSAYASPELDAAIDAVRQNCGNISSELNHMKTMAGINTAVTGVGTAAGVGATAVGIKKSSVDNEIAELKAAQQILPLIEIKDEVAFKQELEQYAQSLPDKADSEIDKKTKESKNLGNWRTGLLAANTATNIAGAAIAGTNHVGDDLKSKIDACIAATNNLSRAMGQARASGDASDTDITRAGRIVTECGMWSTVNISSIDSRAKGATISSGIGAGVGLVGTITSAIANSDKTRENAQKEKNLNNAANVMAGGATVASVTATVFNATQISAIKRASDVADKCEEVLK